MARFYGLIQANAKRAVYSSIETHASSSGQRTSGKKKKAKLKRKGKALYTQSFFQFLSKIIAYAIAVRFPSILKDAESLSIGLQEVPFWVFPENNFW